MNTTKQNSIGSAMQRNIGLDVVRTFAILSVVFNHLIVSYNMHRKTECKWFLIPDGVEVFFVLSGFLIGGILIKTYENEANNFKTMLKFWTMRWFRTLPNYYLFTIVLFVLGGMHFHHFWRNFLFLQNFYHIKNFPFIETWSLCIEEWFYLLFPVVIFLILKLFPTKKKLAILSAVLIFLLICLMMRIWFYVHVYEDHTFRNFAFMRSIVTTRVDSIAVGVFGAWLRFYFPNIYNKNNKTYFLIGLIAFMVLHIQKNNSLFYGTTITFFEWNFSLILSSFAVLLLFPTLEKIEIKNELLHRFFTHTSKVSYSMYLIHFTFLMTSLYLIFTALKIDNAVLFAVVYFVLLYALTAFNYQFFEKRFMDYRQKFVSKYF